jgi:hypothetical protein
MVRTLKNVVVGLALGGLALGGPALAEPGGKGRGKGSDKVTLCHVPPGNPDAAHTITVGEVAVQAHLDHGDRRGACGEDETLTDPTPGKRRRTKKKRGRR